MAATDWRVFLSMSFSSPPKLGIASEECLSLNQAAIANFYLHLVCILRYGFSFYSRAAIKADSQDSELLF